MGHDPAPWFEFDGGRVILWSDDAGSENIKSIDFGEIDSKQLIKNAERDLSAFLTKVEIWALKNYTENPGGLVLGVKKFLRLTTS